MYDNGRYIVKVGEFFKGNGSEKATEIVTDWKLNILKSVKLV